MSEEESVFTCVCDWESHACMLVHVGCVLARIHACTYMGILRDESVRSDMLLWYLCGCRLIIELSVCVLQVDL